MTARDERPENGRARVVLEGMAPEIDAGRFPVKRVVGETVNVEVDAFADGHDHIAVVLRYRHESERGWTEVPMVALGNDRWGAGFLVNRLGGWRYTVEGWVDHFLTWRADFPKRRAAGQDLAVELLIGAALVAAAAARAPARERARLGRWARVLGGEGSPDERESLALSPELAGAMARFPDRRQATAYPRELGVRVDRERARAGAWYELFPRSTRGDGTHGTFADVERRLDYVASMGFDVLYLPPVHPVGAGFRKGPNNALEAGPDDPGSPWAIGSPEGGHSEIHPALGTVADFERLLRSAGERGIEIALDLAFQCSPDHPWVTAHRSWFRERPDGTIQYAENPPKKYQDIYPIDFETEDWRALWDALRGVVLDWVRRGVRIFRVDNPHTKAFAFWEWLIREVQGTHPDVIFLAEAFTRPKVMYRLAKLGFTQSYTYFAWRNSKEELTDYFTELTQTEVREFFRPNLWPNTPDILTEYLQIGGRPAFMIRLVLAATLGASYGIYGPAFELGEHEPRSPGSEEYLNSEKYEIRRWDLEDDWSLREFIARVNRIRRANPALQRDRGLRFHPTDLPSLLCYSKVTEEQDNAMVIVVNLDPRHTQAGWVHLDLAALGLEAGQPFQVHDELGGGRYLWHGSRNYVEFDPHVLPAHVLRVRRRTRTERDFDYFL